ncbi:MAG: hypothetical protein Q9164_002844 [Protoblastenia rupestris]
MAPPPATPSPHRFIAAKTTNSTPKPSSSLRFQAGQGSSSQQFAPTPRFTFGSTQRIQRQDVPSTTQQSSPIARRPYLPAYPNTKSEEIEETSSEYDGGDVQATALTYHAPSSKRPRYNPPDPVLISSDPPSPTTPPTTPPHPTIEHLDTFPLPIHTSPPSHQHPRFLVPTSTSKEHPPPNPNAPIIPSRPPLILPPQSPSPPPLTPSAFYSPTRRGQKYVPTGLAATVRDWIVEAAQTGRHANAREQRQGVWEQRIKVMEMRRGDIGTGLVLVRGEGGEEGRVWMLIGGGRNEDHEVLVGVTVGVRAPVWEVEIAGKTWSVGVEWKVLAG